MFYRNFNIYPITKDIKKKITQLKTKLTKIKNLPPKNKVIRVNTYEDATNSPDGIALDKIEGLNEIQQKIWRNARNMEKIKLNEEV